MSKKMCYLIAFIFIVTASNILNDYTPTLSSNRFQSKNGEFNRIFVPAKASWENVLFFKERFESRNDTTIVLYRLESINILKFWKWREYCFDPQWKPTHIDNAE